MYCTTPRSASGLSCYSIPSAPLKLLSSAWVSLCQMGRALLSPCSRLACLWAIQSESVVLAVPRKTLQNQWDIPCPSTPSELAQGPISLSKLLSCRQLAVGKRQGNGQEKQHTAHRGTTLSGLGTRSHGAPSAELCEESAEAAVTGRQLRFREQQPALFGFTKTVLALTLILHVVVLPFFFQVAEYAMNIVMDIFMNMLMNHIYKCSMLHHSV